MNKIIELNILMAIRDDEILIEDKSSTKAVVGEYEGMVTLEFADSEGKRTYLISKQFAKDLAKALQEKAQ